MSGLGSETLSLTLFVQAERLFRVRDEQLWVLVYPAAQIISTDKLLSTNIFIIKLHEDRNNRYIQHKDTGLTSTDLVCASSMSVQMAGPSTSSAMDVDTVVQTTTSTSHTEHITVTTTPQKNHARPIKRVIPPAAIGYVYDKRMLLHSARNGHTEAPERISRVFEMLEENGYIDLMKELPIRQVEREEVLLVHSEGLWEKVIAISGRMICLQTLPIHPSNIVSS